MARSVHGTSGRARVPTEGGGMPQGGFEIARVRGIAIRAHWTLFVFITWVGWQQMLTGEGWSAAGDAVLTMIGVFVCVVLHELGHALTAMRFGVGTQDITLYPIGGVARLQRMPSEPRQELAIAIAGPAVNIVLMLLLLTVSFATGGPSEAEPRFGETILANLVMVNLAMALFNMLPAIPMDGGRVLRAVLAMWLPRERATHLAAMVSQWLAIGLAFAGIYGSPMLIVIALFVYLGAAREEADTQVHGAVSGARVREAMLTRVRTLPAAAPLRVALEELLASDQQDFPAVDDAGVCIGLLTRDALLRGLSEGAVDDPIASRVDRSARSVAPDDPLERALERMSEGAPSVIVLEAGCVVGLMTGQNLAEWLMIRSVLERSHPPA